MIVARTRWKLIIAGYLAVMGAGPLVYAFWPTEPGVTRGNFQRLEVGSTMAEVEAIFGGPASDFPARGNQHWTYFLT
jgi:hypothetical protein